MYNILDITKNWYRRMKHYKIKKMEKDKIYSVDDVEKIFRDFIKKDKQIKKDATCLSYFEKKIILS